MHCLNTIPDQTIYPLLSRYQLKVLRVPGDSTIPYSFWGDPEAGRWHSTLYVRADTPLHSLLHESAHYVCMSNQQRMVDSIDAKGSALEEAACCYLQLVWSDYIDGFNRQLHMQDMDQWGYNFRLGSTARWFKQDSEDARQWLIRHKIIARNDSPTWKVRSH